MTEPIPVFVPALSDPKTFGRSVPPLLDLVGRDLGDEMDVAAAGMAAAHPGASALWRAWQLSPGQDPLRVYVLESSTPVSFPIPMAVYERGTRPSDEIRTARNAGALLWTRAEAPPIRLARVFDLDGRFTADHPVLAGETLDLVATYLEAGAPVLGTAALLPDVVAPERGEVVPTSYRTDGRWLWADSVAYYLREHGLAPEPDLLSHVLVAGSLPAPDPADEHRALALLFQSAGFVAV
ncbi:hypothetical protein [Actinoplanes sp. NPDC051494]|uniref:hypothetical protein n=1 Tax=Actinoplanes sp. NPDC051494 TaxID=3363907 RepID=UPI0037A33351